MAQKLTPKERTRFVRLFGDGDPRAAEEFFSKLVTIMRDALAGAPKLIASLTTALQGAGANDGQIQAFLAGLGLAEPTPEAFRTLILSLAGEAAGNVETRVNQRIDELPESRDFVGTIADAIANAERTDRDGRIRRIRGGLARILSEGLTEGQPPLKDAAIAYELANAVDRRFHPARYTQENEFLEHLRTAWETFVAEMAKVVEPMLAKKYATDAPAIARWLLAERGVTERRAPDLAKAAINEHPVFADKLLATHRTKK